MFEIIQKLKEKTGLAFYVRPQKYEVTYEVILQNTTRATKDFTLVLPVLRESAYQAILKLPEFMPAPFSLNIDPLYSNRYALFFGSAAPNESLIFRYTAQVAVKPQRIEPTQTFSLSDYRQLDRETLTKWTTPTTHIDARDSRIIHLAEEIGTRASDVIGIVKCINNYVIKRLRYGGPITGLYTLNEVLKKESVDCGGFDVLFITLCHALGIPARLVSGFWAGYKDNIMHAWAEVLLPDGQWLPADPSLEQLGKENRTMKSGRLGFVGSDRLVISCGSDIPLDLNGKKTTADILQNPFSATEGSISDLVIRPHLRTRRL